jgi:hypothetical protein
LNSALFGDTVPWLIAIPLIVAGAFLRRYLRRASRPDGVQAIGREDVLLVLLILAIYGLSVAVLAR